MTLLPGWKAFSSLSFSRVWKRLDSVVPDEGVITSAAKGSNLANRELLGWLLALISKVYDGGRKGGREGVKVFDWNLREKLGNNLYGENFDH